jgi:hypothetical protein
MTSLSGVQQELFWLNTANIVLGVVVAICLAVVAVGLFREFQVRARRRAALSSGLDRELHQMMGDGHAFEVPGLGLTMADGGERVEKPSKKKKTH